MYRSLQQAISDSREQLLEPAALKITLGTLLEQRSITTRQAAALHALVPRQLQESSYLLGHLGAHLGIGVVFAFDVIPLPLGTVCRVLWVTGARLAETLKGNLEKARLHSLPVFLIAAIPWLGYAAYLLPLRRQSRELAFLLANHVWLLRTGRSYEEMVSERSLPVRRFCRWLVPELPPVCEN